MRVAPVRRARIASADVRVQAPTLVGGVASRTSHTVVAGETHVEKQQIAQLHLGIVPAGKTDVVVRRLGIVYLVQRLAVVAGNGRRRQRGQGGKTLAVNRDEPAITAPRVGHCVQAFAPIGLRCGQDRVDAQPQEKLQDRYIRGRARLGKSHQLAHRRLDAIDLLGDLGVLPVLGRSERAQRNLELTFEPLLIRLELPDGLLNHGN